MCRLSGPEFDPPVGLVQHNVSFISHVKSDFILVNCGTDYCCCCCGFPGPVSLEVLPVVLNQGLSPDHLSRGAKPTLDLAI